MLHYTYNKFNEILSSVPVDDLITFNKNTKVIGYTQWQTINKNKPGAEFKKKLSFLLNRLTLANLEVEYKNIENILEDSNRGIFFNTIIKNVLINNYYSELYCILLKKLKYVVKKEQIDNLFCKYSDLSDTNKQEYYSMVTFLSYSIIHKLSNKHRITDILDNCISIIKQGEDHILINIYAECIKIILTIMKTRINSNQIEQCKFLSSDKSIKSRSRFLILDGCDSVHL